MSYASAGVSGSVTRIALVLAVAFASAAQDVSVSRAAAKIKSILIYNV